jgi:hypothetical protein
MVGANPRPCSFRRLNYSEPIDVGFRMKLALSFGFAVLLVLTGATRSLWSDNTDKIAASAKSGSALAFGEAIENWNDDRMIASCPLASAVASSDVSLIATPFISQTYVELNSIKDDSRVYKLNSTFLI